jgi:hypothetical protein
MSITPTEQRFFADIAQILQTGRNQSYRAVNIAMLQTYWQLGQRIVKEEQHGQARAEYGQSILPKLSRYLGDQFGQGFSVANLRNFRQFYLTFPNFDEFVTHCVANLFWTHVRLIMRLDNDESQQLFASKYQTLLPTEAELAAMLEQEAAKCIRDTEDNVMGGEA